MPFSSQFEDASPYSMGIHLLLNHGAPNDFMSLRAAKNAPLSLYERTKPGHFMTAEGVEVEVRYYIQAHVRAGDFLFRHHLSTLQLL